ncbi:MAG: glycosyltransferase family A protein [Bryobacteraceae bacterium]
MSAPLITIVVPCGDRADLLAGALDSVFAQSIADWELLVVCDTRPPNLPRNARVQCVAGVKTLNAPAVAFLEPGDTWEPEKLARSLDALAQAPDAALVAGDYRMVDAARQRATTMKQFLLHSMLDWWRTDPLAAAAIPCDAIAGDIAQIARPDLVLSMAIAGFQWIHSSSAVIRREALLSVGPLDGSLRRADLWLQLNRAGRIVYLDEVLADCVVTGETSATGYREAAARLRLLDDIEAWGGLKPAQRKLLQNRRAAQHRICAGAAFRGFATCWRALPHTIAGLRLTAARLSRSS